MAVELRSESDRRRVRRTDFIVGMTGALLVIAAIPTGSRIFVAVGLILAVLGHALMFASYVTRWPESRRLGRRRRSDPQR